MTSSAAANATLVSSNARAFLVHISLMSQTSMIVCVCLSLCFYVCVSSIFILFNKLILL